MSIVIAGSEVISTARAASAMDRVVPIVVVIGGRAIPASIRGSDGVVGPTNSRVLIANDDSLPGVAHRPNLRRVDALYAQFDGVEAFIRFAGIGDLGIFDPALWPVRLDF